MSNFELYSYGSSDCPDVTRFSPQGDFFISVEFDIKRKNEEGVATYYFFLATKKGFENQKYSNELEFIEIVDDYSFDFVKNYLEEKVVRKVEELDDTDLFSYLNSNFNFEND
jgi:hypothetical protein